MCTPKKYIIKIKDEGHWKETCLTDPEGKEYLVNGAVPVSYEEVIAALKDARTRYPDCVYKIVEV